MKIVISGVTRGLGRALAEEFIRLGHTVAGCGRGAEGIIDLRFAYGAPHSFDVADVADPVKVGIWAAKVLGFGEAPDLLINNAAIMNRPAPLWQVQPEEAKRLIDINVTGTINVIREFVPPMVAARKGVIINLSSGWGRSVSPEVAPYCASKWAIEGLTKALAEELPEGMAAIPEPGCHRHRHAAYRLGRRSQCPPQGRRVGEGRGPLNPETRAGRKRAERDGSRLR